MEPFWPIHTIECKHLLSRMLVASNPSARPTLQEVMLVMSHSWMVGGFPGPPGIHHLVHTRAPPGRWSGSTSHHHERFWLWNWTKTRQHPGIRSCDTHLGFGQAEDLLIDIQSHRRDPGQIERFRLYLVLTTWSSLIAEKDNARNYNFGNYTDLLDLFSSLPTSMYFYPKRERTRTTTTCDAKSWIKFRLTPCGTDLEGRGRDQKCQKLQAMKGMHHLLKIVLRYNACKWYRWIFSSSNFTLFPQSTWTWSGKY